MDCNIGKSDSSTHPLHHYRMNILEHVTSQLDRLKTRKICHSHSHLLLPLRENKVALKSSRLQSPGIGEKGDYTIQRSDSLKRIDILAEWIGVWGNFQSGSNRRFDRSLCHSRHLSSHRWNSKYQSSHSPTHSIHPAQTREHFQSNHLLSQWLRGSVW